MDSKYVVSTKHIDLLNKILDEITSYPFSLLLDSSRDSLKAKLTKYAILKHEVLEIKRLAEELSREVADNSVPLHYYFSESNTDTYANTSRIHVLHITKKKNTT